jgi:hypothetical protein
MAKNTRGSGNAKSTGSKSEAYAQAKQQEGTADEAVALKSGLYISSAGMFNEVTEYPPGLGEYGPHKAVGAQPFPVDRPSDKEGAYGGVLIRKNMEGKRAGEKGG